MRVVLATVLSQCTLSRRGHAARACGTAQRDAFAAAWDEGDRAGVARCAEAGPRACGQRTTLKLRVRRFEVLPAASRAVAVSR